MAKGERHSSRLATTQWMDSDQELFERWMEGYIPLENGIDDGLHPALRQFSAIVSSDPLLNLLFSEMFKQVPEGPPYHEDPRGGPRVEDFQHMLRLFNQLISQAPEYDETVMAGLPLHAMLNWVMGTKSGFCAFLHPKVNACLKAILNEWARFLKSPASRHVLNDSSDSGWFGPAAKKAMPNFADDFECQPQEPFHGFASWDDFFTRKLRPGARPVAMADDDTVIANCCESAPYKISRNVKMQDQFWIKAEPYSLRDLMASDPLAEYFEGGTVYQAFLSAFSYHRWHSPVSGRIVKACVIEGAFCSVTLAREPAPASQRQSQTYLAHVAARALIFIEADNPDIGTVCFAAIGMCEVSSCEITVQTGQHVNKGEQLGMFHFGGSTYCLVLRPELHVEFDLRDIVPGPFSKNIRVNEKLATVTAA